MNNIKEYYGSIKSAYNAICTKRANHNKGMEEQCGCINTVLKNCPKYNKVLFNSPLCKEAYNNILNNKCNDDIASDLVSQYEIEYGVRYGQNNL